MLNVLLRGSTVGVLVFAVLSHLHKKLLEIHQETGTKNLN